MRRRAPDQRLAPDGRADVVIARVHFFDDELLALAAEDAAVLSWHGLAPADRASDTALRRAAAFWPERLAARRLMEARLYALACDSL